MVVNVAASAPTAITVVVSLPEEAGESDTDVEPPKGTSGRELMIDP
jgi:hypothetical protein